MHRGLATALAVTVTCSLAACRRHPARPCKEAARAQAWPAAIAACRVGFWLHGDPDDGLRLAVSLERVGRMREVVPIATVLHTGPRAADGAYYLGVAAMRAEHYVDAEPLFREAMDGFRARGDDHRVAETAQQLAGSYDRRGHHRAAADILVEGAAAAQRAGDPSLFGYVGMARSDILRHSGERAEAERALDTAVADLQGNARDRAWANLKLGILHLDRGRYQMARAALEQSLANARGLVEVVESAHLNLAWLAVHDGDADDAAGHLAAVDPHSTKASNRVGRGFGDAEVARLRGQLADADARFAAIDPADLSEQWSWVVPLYRARLAEQRGDDRDAEAWLRRAVAEIERQRAARHDEPLYLDTHREPYYELFALYARTARWRDALTQVVSLDAADLLDAPGQGILRWGWASGPQRTMPDAPPLSPAQLTARVDTLLAASRITDVVIDAVAGGKLWRLTLRGGAVDGESVATADDALALVDLVIADPGDRTVADKLGALMLPARGTGPLYVAPLGDLGRVPLAALRVSGHLVIETRPLVRLVTLATPEAAATDASDRNAAIVNAAIVLGDPDNDLPRAAEEARRAASELGATAAIGGDATSQRLLVAAATLVHVASHAGVDDRGVFVRLADRAVYGDEIARARWSAHLVVLASCGSAASRDPQGRGSLASAFVRGGARAVLGALWSVEDDATARLVSRFYEAGGARDPAAALAIAQRALAADLPARQWAAFTIVGAPPLPASASPAM